MLPKKALWEAMLAAVALDRNCGLFLIVVTIVELENEDSWGWFLHRLSSIIGNFSKPLAVMNDGQKVSKLNFFNIHIFLKNQF